ncbi:MAG: hypothetical protein K6E47_10275 [Lachnospiraceae bacterium]|nr:hypothetical protein [Lachnospiraceae bacterium]
MKKNYLDHDTTVKFMDQYYAKEKDWQWFIDIIENDFDFEDVDSWNDYDRKCWAWIQPCSYLMKIIEVGYKKLEYKNTVVEDIFIVTEFGQGINSIDDVISKLSTKYGKIFFWVVWTTKLEKQDNDLIFLYDNDLFTFRNVWMFRNLTSLELYRDDLLDYGKQISVDGIDNCVKNLKDNIDRIRYEASSVFLDDLKKTCSLQDLFGYHGFQIRCFSWQERLILGLINHKISIDKAYPIENIFGKLSEDDINNQLYNLRTYFNDSFIDIILDTVFLVCRDKEPSFKTKCMYFGAWEYSLDDEKHFKVFNSAVFAVISRLFSKGMTSEIKKENEFLDFVNNVQQITDVYDLQRLIDAHFPLSTEQKRIIKEYQENAYKQINTINDPYMLKDYFRNDVVCKSIDNDFFCKVREKFVIYLENDSIKRILPEYFYEYMVFLIRVKNMSRSVSKKEIDITIIGIQKMWEEKYYSIACEGLQTFTSKTEVPTAEVEKYNQEVLKNPLAFAKACMNLDEDNVCEIMMNASENAISYMFTRMQLSKIYPIKNDSVNLERHDVDGFLTEFINRIREEKEYKFLNQLDSNKYLMALYESIHVRSRICISMFHGEQNIYEKLEQTCNTKMLPYTDDLLLAHVTQLFPILEQRIREVSEIFGVAPFKEDLNSFMQFKDPSSLLREMIEEAYKETGNFELIYDLMFVYCFMYNSNSLNIRNECIHGRGFYNSAGEILFAFRVTLLSIYMIEYRIQLVSGDSNN